MKKNIESIKENNMENLDFNNILNSLPRSYWKDKKRPVGRGYGSGKGRTAAKGHKGQLGTSGHVRAGFEGGQTPVFRRTPKRGGEMGTNRRFRKLFTINSEHIKSKLGSEDVNIKNLKRAFKIPFYYRRIKVIGSDKEQYKNFIKPQALLTRKKELSKKRPKNNK